MKDPLPMLLLPRHITSSFPPKPNPTRRSLAIAIRLLALAVLATGEVQAQPPAPPPAFASVEFSQDPKITFRIHAPEAKKVVLNAGDIPGTGRGLEMKKGEDGVWEVQTQGVPAGAYRYQFMVDAVAVLDPRNSKTSESNGNAWSLIQVTGSPWFDLRDVPHGAVSEIHYQSKTLQRNRRLHVYTPPGYESSTATYPVFYLLHGAFDCDDSWSTVGQANAIFDNLIAENKIVPMVVVMPAGHTGAFGAGPGNNFEMQMKEFAEDFRKDIRPMIESRYRVSNERKDRAIAGLSMGGAHTLDIAFTDIQDFSYVGVFSSGVFGIDRSGTDSGPGATWIAAHKKCLEDASQKEGLKSLWFATGKEDFLLGTTQATVQMLKDRGWNPTYHETDGGHTWLKWRDYLVEYSQLLFR